MLSTQEELLSIGRVESVTSRGHHLDVVLRLLPAGKPLPRRLENRKAIVATVDDVAQTRLDVRSVVVDGDALRVSLSGLRRQAQRVTIRVEGLVPGLDVATVLLSKTEPAFDPSALPAAPPGSDVPSLVSYLFKDFRSFRQLMLDTISHEIPGFIERHEADVAIATVEILAFAADHLSYFQDAVATEAYLETARRRVSVRRHARLVNYELHEGCSPRVWVQVVPSQAMRLPRGFKVATTTDASLTRRVYETLADTMLYPELSSSALWDYGTHDYVLAAGSTAATIACDLPVAPAPAVMFRKNDVVIFEQLVDANNARVSPKFRQAVRLSMDAKAFPHPSDPKKMLSRIEWSEEDALTFDFPARTLVESRDCATAVLGNIVAADFGETRSLDVEARIDDRGRLHVFAPDLTYAVPYNPTEPAAAFTDIRPYRAAPAIWINASAFDMPSMQWNARRDLIGADPYDRSFAVEGEPDGSLLLRFGDGVNGWLPDPASHFEMTYRAGNGTAGRVGPDAIVEVDDRDLPIQSVRNPLPSGGGKDPMDVGKAKRQAPELVHAQRRCITDADFTRIAQSTPGVFASIERRWTGSGTTIDVYVHAVAEADKARARVARELSAACPIGVEIFVRAPRRVGVIVKLGLEYERGALPNEVSANVVAQAKAALDAQCLTLGKTLFASWLILAASRVPGVASVTLLELRRLDGPDMRVDGLLRFAPTELAVLVDEFGMMTDGRPLVQSVNQ
jgi:hypothetical protein